MAVYKRKYVRVASLFSGCGGMDLGFSKARSKKLRYSIVWANDIDKDAAETYKNNLNSNIVCKDVWKINMLEVPDADVIIGGFPCEDFSVLRGAKRDKICSTRGLLYKRLIDAIKVKQPSIFVAENVKGLLSVKNGKVMEEIKRTMEEDLPVKYELHTKLINFADYGVPQMRERVIIVGIRKDSGICFSFPRARYRERHVPVKEAFRGVKNILYNNEKTEISDKIKGMLNKIPPGGNYKDTRRYKDMNWMSVIYRKLDKNKPAPTIIAGGGGGTHLYHYSEQRAITNRERARLQGFPDKFKFSGNITSVRRQIGNAVPPGGIRPIASEILRAIEANESKRR